MITTYNDKRKQDIRDRYDTCNLTAYFVNLMLNGKEVPDISDVYPGVFEEDEDEEATIKYYEKQFSMLATAVNSSRKGK